MIPPIAPEIVDKIIDAIGSVEIPPDFGHDPWLAGLSLIAAVGVATLAVSLE